MRGLFELVGAGAVLLGLVFVSVELRQNIEAVEAASLQYQTDASTDYLLLIASDVELARIWLDAATDPSQLNEIVLLRYFFLSQARWLRMQNAFLQWRRGPLRDEDWSFYNGVSCRAGIDGAIRFESTWDEHKLPLTEGFVELVENCWSNSQ